MKKIINPITAVNLSLLVPGLSHIFSEKYIKGIVIFLVTFSIPDIYFDFILPHIRLHPINVLLYFIIIIFWYVFVIFDSIKTAKKANANKKDIFHIKWYHYIVLFVVAIIIMRILIPFFKTTGSIG